jgi:aspartokinase
VVLSAVSGTTDTLIKLSRANEQDGQEILYQLDNQYKKYVVDLLSTPESINAANHFLAVKFAELSDLLSAPVPRDERVFVSFGEIMSTLIVHDLCNGMRHFRSALTCP